MIDPITEHILMEAKAIDSLKRIIPQLKSSILKKDFRGMISLSNKLPQKKNFKQLKQEVMRLPNFRQKYAEAKKAISRSKVLDKSVHEPASVAIAIVGLSSSAKISEIIKTGEKGVLQSSMILNLIPGGAFIVPIIKLSFFIIVITTILITAGNVVIPALVAFVKGIGYILSIIGKGLAAIGKVGAGLVGDKVTFTDGVNAALGTTIQPGTLEAIGKAMETTPPGTAGLWKTKLS
jgi:hypothetical protein